MFGVSSVVPTAARFGDVSPSNLLLLPSRSGALRRGTKHASHKERIRKMDMKKYSGEHFIKVDDVRDGPIEGQIAVIREGKYGKPDLIFESGDVLSLNATNNKTLLRAYGTESDRWISKMIKMFLGTIEYQGSDHEAVLVEPISPPIKKDKKKPPDFDDEIPFR